MHYADVILPVPLEGTFTYAVPQQLQGQVAAGMRVLVPFGRSKSYVGIVARLHDEQPEGYEVKPLAQLMDRQPILLDGQMLLWQWMADYYMAPLGDVMKAALPAGLKAEEGYKPRTETYIRLTEPYRNETTLHIALNMLARAPRQQEAFIAYLTLSQWDTVEGNGTTEPVLEITREELMNHCGAPLATISQLVKRGMLETYEVEVSRLNRGGEPHPGLIKKMSAPQQEAYNQILFAFMKKNVCLFHGVTGSGKTEIYIHLIQREIEQKRQVLYLLPEIALTGQVVRAFQAYFPEDIVVLHSRLSLAERNDACLRVRRKEAGVIIGARSALFTPAADIGLIVLDEEQDMSYKQDESPRYQARAVAEELAGIHQAVLLLGSATPSIESYYRAEKGELTLLALPERIGNLPLPQVECVDMREELRHGNRHIISGALRRLLEETLARHEQAVIMLNRRGYSTFVMCRACGEVLKCKLCGLPLVYHRDGHLACHHCDVQERVPDICPKCGSRYIKYFGSGTEKLEQELRALLPSARVIRMDRDTTGRKFAHADILGRFRRHEYDILLGTQMVAKGHDIPNVTAVGIISADSSLNMPDFRAAERCFMLITQTAGRAGRHGSRGRVVIQTYNPGHYAVAYGIAQDYEGFYRQEIALRRELFYPPFSRLVKLIFQGKEAEAVRERGAAFVRAFGEAFPGSRQQLAIGPVPAAIACLRGTYRFVVLIKTGELQETRQFLRSQGLHLRRDVAIDIDPIAMF